MIQCYSRTQSLAYCNYQRSDWIDCLPSAECNTNDTESETTYVNPFFANTAEHPHYKITPRTDLTSINSFNYLKIREKIVDKFVDQIHDHNSFFRENMITAQDFHEKKENNRCHLAPSYSIGDLVFVKAENIKTKIPNKKLDWKILGPFRIIKLIGSYNYQVELPSTLISVNLIFNASLLRSDPNNPTPGWTNEPNPTFEIHAILGFWRHRYRVFKYEI